MKVSWFEFLNKLVHSIQNEDLTKSSELTVSLKEPKHNKGITETQLPTKMRIDH